jgi:hypothetical protein
VSWQGAAATTASESGWNGMLKWQAQDLSDSLLCRLVMGFVPGFESLDAGESVEMLVE